MKFEEILPLMRDGKKARRPCFGTEEYYMCTINFFPAVSGEPSPKWLSITKCRDEYIHEDMKKSPPFIYIEDILADDWEIVE